MKIEHEEVELFYSITQFRTFEHTLNIARFTETILREVQMPGKNLKEFLITALCNHGEISQNEIRDLTTELFVGEKADEVLGSLERDKCLGYSQEEILNIRLMLKSHEAPDYNSTAVQEALGCKIAKNTFRR